MGWNGSDLGPVTLVDGKQRLDAALGFLHNEVPVFGGHYLKDFEDASNLRSCTRACFNWYVNHLSTYQEVLSWYLDLNSAGVPHSEAELSRVRDLLRQAGPDFPMVSDHQDRLASARLDRSLVKAEIDIIQAKETTLEKATAIIESFPPSPLKKRALGLAQTAKRKLSSTPTLSKKDSNQP